MTAKTSLVGIVLGSRSDVEHAKKISAILNELDIPHEVTVASAHRTPGDVSSYSLKAMDRGIRVIIAIAGLSAALPGVIAAHTILPVIGVPVVSGSLAGLDALLSITQMPPGVPVASVGINGSRNAALLAARMISQSDEKTLSRLTEWLKNQEKKTKASRDELEDLPKVPADAF